MRILIWAAIGAACLPAPVSAQRMSDVEARRMLALARVWGEAKYFHPALAGARIRWDSIGAAAIDAVDRASGNTSATTDLSNAVSTMLRALDDPATRVIATGGVAARSTTSGDAVMPRITWAA